MNIKNDITFPKYLNYLSTKVNTSINIIEKVYDLFQEGLTVPFIVRYRQNEVNNINSEDCYLLQRKFNEYETMIRLRNSRIEKLKRSENFDPASELRLLNCLTMEELDEAYNIYKESTSTKIQKAKSIPGLVEIADALLNNQPLPQPIQNFDSEFHELLQWYIADAIAHGEIVSDILKNYPMERFVLLTVDEKVSKGDISNEKIDERRKYQDYFNFSKPLNQITPHQVLAIRRGKETADVLRIHFTISDYDINRLKQRINSAYSINNSTLSTSTTSSTTTNSYRRNDIINNCIIDAIKRIIIPMISRSAWRNAINMAEEESIKIFCKNLKSLLLTPPLRAIVRSESQSQSLSLSSSSSSSLLQSNENLQSLESLAHRIQSGNLIVMGIDPGFKQGHKIVIMDCSIGHVPRVITHQKIICYEPNKINESSEILKSLCQRYHVDVIAIGNGTGHRLAQMMCDKIIPELPLYVNVAVVSEAGASVYSVSPLAEQEYPDEQVIYRGAISIALRLVDPLCELVKVPPPSIGVGMYQHDIKEKTLEQRLGGVLEEVVSEIGVDVNTASQHVLTYASGINKSQAASIVEYRSLHGPFQTREEIKSVKGIGKIAFQNAAGFLRIMDGNEPLDSTIVHPEKYNIVKSLLNSAFSYNTNDSTHNNSNVTEESNNITSTNIKKKKKINQSILLNNENIRNLLFSQQLRNYFESPSCNWNNHSMVLNEDIENLKLLSRWISDPYFNTTNQIDIRNLKGIPPKLTRKCILSPDDFHVGLMVSGIVRNITTFGVFVDIGSKEDALLHRTKYGTKNEFIIGEVLECYIIEINEQKGGKISLSLSQSDCITNNNNNNIRQNQNNSSQNQSYKYEYQSDDEVKNTKIKQLKESTTTIKQPKTQKKRKNEEIEDNHNNNSNSNNMVDEVKKVEKKVSKRSKK